MPTPGRDLLRPATATKLELIATAGAVESALEFGGVWRVDMLYLKYCLKKGARHGTEVDIRQPTDPWPGIDVVLGDFRDSTVLARTPRASLVLLYDIVLHQVDVMRTFRSLVAKARRYVAFNQPMFDVPSQAMRNVMFYLPGNDLSQCGMDVDGTTSRKESLKIDRPEDFGPTGLENPDRWHWAMAPDLVRTWFRFLGFRIVHETREAPMKWLKAPWIRWGCLAERV